MSSVAVHSACHCCSVSLGHVHTHMQVVSYSENPLVAKLLTDVHITKS